MQGNCATRLNVAAMTEEEKYSWAARCGARPPVMTEAFLIASGFVQFPCEVAMCWGRPTQL